MANLDGIIPALPSGGTYSNRQQYGPNGSTNPNYFESEFTQSMADTANQAAKKAGYMGGNLYNPGGYIYGYGDPVNPDATQAQFSQNLTKYVAGGKIIPSQYTQTVAQSVGPAQFQMNGQTATVGQGNTSSPFTATAAAPAQQAPDPSANQPFLFGFNGDKGVLNGTFGNTTAGQAAPFYQSGAMTPQQQALIQSR